MNIPTTMVTSTQNIDTGYTLFLVNPSENITLTLPDNNADGYYFIFKRIDSKISITVSLNGYKDQPINDKSSLDIPINSGISIISYNSVWYTIS